MTVPSRRTAFCGRPPRGTYAIRPPSSDRPTLLKIRGAVVHSTYLFRQFTYYSTAPPAVIKMPLPASPALPAPFLPLPRPAMTVSVSAPSWACPTCPTPSQPASASSSTSASPPPPTFPYYPCHPCCLHRVSALLPHLRRHQLPQLAHLHATIQTLSHRLSTYQWHRGGAPENLFEMRAGQFWNLCDARAYCHARAAFARVVDSLALSVAVENDDGAIHARALHRFVLCERLELLRLLRWDNLHVHILLPATLLMLNMDAHCAAFVRTWTSLVSARLTSCVDADAGADSVGSSVSSDDDEPGGDGSDSYGSAICELYRHPAAVLGKWVYGAWDPGDDLLVSLPAAFNSPMSSDDNYNDASLHNISEADMTSTIAMTVAATLLKLKLINQANEARVRWATFASSQLAQRLNNDCALHVRGYLDNPSDDFIAAQQRLVRRYVTSVQRRQPALWQALLKRDERSASVQGACLATIVQTYGPVLTRLPGVAVLLTELTCSINGADVGVRSLR